MYSIGRDPFVKVGLPTQSHPSPCHFGSIRHFDSKLIRCFYDGRRIPVQSTKCPTLCAYFGLSHQPVGLACARYSPIGSSVVMLGKNIPCLQDVRFRLAIP